MSGQYRPNPTDRDILWRTVAYDGPDMYLVLVEQVHGTTRDQGWLYVFTMKDTLAPIHRAAVTAKESPLLGVNPQQESEWENEALKAILHPEYRQIQGV